MNKRNGSIKTDLVELIVIQVHLLTILPQQHIQFASITRIVPIRNPEVAKNHVLLCLNPNLGIAKANVVLVIGD